MNIDDFKKLLNDVLSNQGPDSALNQFIKSVDNRRDLSQSLYSLQARHTQNEKLFYGNHQDVGNYNMERSKIDVAIRELIATLEPADLIDETWEFNPVETEKEQPDSAFISTPIASFTADEYKRMKKIVKDLIRVLRYELEILHIYYAGEDIDGVEDFHSPEVAIKQDMQGICSYEFFILIYPGRYISSVLVEAGYALALRKKCLFFVQKRSDLPFILQSADKVFKRVRIVEYGAMEDIPGLLKTEGLQ